jgi:hypothetical protein
MIAIDSGSDAPCGGECCWFEHWCQEARGEGERWCHKGRKQLTCENVGHGCLRLSVFTGLE